jgi:hypothetical protein
MRWIVRADGEIQTLHNDWQFLWGQRSIPTVIGQGIYTPPSGLRAYDEKTFRLDGDELEVVDYLDVRHEPIDTTPGRPYRAVRMPNNSLRLDSPPNAVYTLSYDWYRTPVRIDVTLGNGATSIIPEAYQQAIVGLALMYYARYEPAEELLPQASEMYSTWMRALESGYLPGKRENHQQSEGNLDMSIRTE